MKFDVNKFNTFIFDFDGVIVDSVNIKTEAFAEIYRPFGEEVVSKVVSHHISHGGINRFDKIRYYHKNYLNQEISDFEVSKLASKFSDIVFKKVINAPFIEGALKFLEFLKKNNKKMFIISATPEEEIKRIVAGRKLNKYFIDIKGAPISKKKNLKKIIKLYKINAVESVYFGDAEEDLNTASSCSITFVPINYFNNNNSKGYKNFAELMEKCKKINLMFKSIALRRMYV